MFYTAYTAMIGCWSFACEKIVFHLLYKLKSKCCNCSVTILWLIEIKIFSPSLTRGLMRSTTPIIRNLVIRIFQLSG